MLRPAPMLGAMLPIRPDHSPAAVSPIFHFLFSVFRIPKEQS
jgi:hypothetical protein